MRIAIINLTGGGISGGYKKYLLNIIPRMANNVDVESILCASPANLKVQDWFEPYHNVKFVSCLPFSLSGRNDLSLKQELEDFTPEVIFIPIERYLSFKKVPVVNMVQNMLPMVSICNNTMHERLRNYIQRHIAKRAVKKSQRVIAISNYVKEYISNEWGIPSNRIGLVYHGISLTAGKETKKADTIPKEWGTMFLFTAGSIDPYRGLEDIFLAMKSLITRGVKVRLVIAGDVRPAMLNYQSRLKDLIQEMNISSNVCWAGKLKEDEMIWCYQNCQAFIMSSRIEACPNIALEAMSNGCISISANNPPLPEFFEDVAYYYEPYDERSLANSICSVLNLMTTQKTYLSKKAVERASEFSWDITVEKTLNELRKATESA